MGGALPLGREANGVTPLEKGKSFPVEASFNRALLQPAALLLMCTAGNRCDLLPVRGGRICWMEYTRCGGRYVT